ncbi:hypothetical protein RRG08_003827 [Elysia crispata]|uniref:Uncharacterized protein n=1 Tax=Elysia crispata TaxID=231223 RepID=A0AAE1DF35_9GAST|nr:hypothetical protein RRG08_003827 [Elysia crispata]
MRTRRGEESVTVMQTICNTRWRTKPPATISAPLMDCTTIAGMCPSAAAGSTRTFTVSSSSLIKWLDEQDIDWLSGSLGIQVTGWSRDCSTHSGLDPRTSNKATGANCGPKADRLRSAAASDYRPYCPAGIVTAACDEASISGDNSYCLVLLSYGNRNGPDLLRIACWAHVDYMLPNRICLQ